MECWNKLASSFTDDNFIQPEVSCARDIVLSFFFLKVILTTVRKNYLNRKNLAWERI